MDINELKPDFEKIAFAINFKKGIPDFLYKDWESILNTENSYEIIENIEFKKLLQDYHLQAHYKDFLFLAYKITRREKIVPQIAKSLRSIKSFHDELLYSLKFLYDNDLVDLKIKIEHKTKKSGVSITNELLIKRIKDSLLEFYINQDINFEEGFADPDRIKDWGKYIDFVVLEREAHLKKKGRKQKPGFTGSYIDSLQVYLQEFTQLKAEKEIIISRSQATFIYKFLNILGIISSEIAWHEDNIRHMLFKFREKRDLPHDSVEAMEKHSQYAKKIKTKIQNINKNK